MHDILIRGGTIVTATAQFQADLAIDGERIAAIGHGLQGRTVIDATNRLVLPGGVDTHCHIEQLQADGGADEETWSTGTRSALAGGTTSVVTFSTQFKGRPIGPSLAEYRKRARASRLDYALHQIITDPSPEVLAELPALVGSGIHSFKAFLTYDPLHLTDAQFLRVLDAARTLGALVTVHAENYDAIAWRTEALLASGCTAPKYHAHSRPKLVELEATQRAIALAELAGAPIEIFHVSCPEVAALIEAARARGLPVWGETCPQYLVLTAADMDRPDFSSPFEGAKFMCSPAPRDAAAQDGLWAALRRGALQCVSSDHSGWCYDGPRGKRVNGDQANFRDIPNGLPGLAARMPLLWSEGVHAGRITPPDFVRLTATAPAALFGLHQKGRLDPGADADIVLWDPARQVTLTNALMQHAIDYTPYEGHQVTGWPETVLLRGQVVMQHDQVRAAEGYGRYLSGTSPSPPGNGPG